MKKKKFYFATLVIAALSFTGCANDEYVGDQRNLGEQNGAIAFSTKSTNTVRATSEGSDAADKLHGQFWVYGTKTVGNNELQPVFKDYKVVYDNDNANKSTSNTKGWEYVIPGTTQTIKYWDYSAKQYDFQAYSINGDGTVARNTVESYANGTVEVGEYIVSDISQDGCANLYFADKNTVSKSSNSGENKYGAPVKLTFKSVLSKIRVGFYETIQGYSVKIDKFYGPNDNNDANGGATNGDDQKFVAWCPNKKIDDSNKSFVVTYADANNATPAITKVKIKNDERYELISDNGNGYILNQQLELGNNFFLPSNEDKTIGDSYSTVTWDKQGGIYTYFIPQNQLDGKVKEMKIKVDYTLTSDKDDSKEKIYVKGATAIVPAQYLKWEPNKAYSYVFKISVNTNGTTGDTGDLAGLYPITFDAVVEQMEDYRKDYLTTVSDLSITATQDGPFADADKAVFKTGEAINVKVMYNSNDITSNVGSQTGSNKFEVAFVENTDYDYNKSPEHNLPSGTSLASKTAESSVITLEGQSAGYWIVKVTYTADGKNITKYAVLKVGTETTSTSGNGAGGGE